MLQTEISKVVRGGGRGSDVERLGHPGSKAKSTMLQIRIMTPQSRGNDVCDVFLTVFAMAVNNIAVVIGEVVRRSIASCFSAL